MIFEGFDMSQEQKPTEPIILNRKEMLALMNLMGVHSLVGVELQDESVQKDLKVLSAKGKSIRS